MTTNEEQKFFGTNRFGVHNGVTLIHVEPDHAVTGLTVGPETLNPYGAIHGGAFFAMADSAAGAAARTDGREYVTQCADVHFIRNQGSGTVRAESSVIHRGRATCLVNVEIKNEEDKLLAAGTFTFFCLTRE